MLALPAAPNQCRARQTCLSPTALAAAKNEVFIACATGNRGLRFNIAQRKITASLPMPAPLSGLRRPPMGSIFGVNFITATAKLAEAAGLGSKAAVNLSIKRYERMMQSNPVAAKRAKERITKPNKIGEMLNV